MKLESLTGVHLLAAYSALHPDHIAPADNDYFLVQFQAWLDALRAGATRHNLSFDQSYTGHRTRALLRALEVEAPQNVRQLVLGLGLHNATLRYELLNRRKV